MSDAMSIGVSGLLAAQAALQVTSQNVSNINTPGYHRENIAQSEISPTSTGFGYPGNGVQVTNVQRIASDFFDNQVNTATALNSSLNTQYNYLNQLDNTVADSTTGLASSLQNFFGSLQSLSSNPSSLPSRQAVMDQASTMIDSFQSVNAQIVQMNQGINTQLASDVTTLNGLSQQFASLNVQIANLHNIQGANEPNALLDQRSQVLTQISQLISTQTVTQSNGSMDVYIGSGQSLVLGGSAIPLQTQPSAANAQQLAVGMANNNSEIPSSLLTGGSIGGALSMRATLSATQQSIGAIAINTAIAINQQQRDGVNLNGAAGQNIFQLSFNFPPLSVAGAMTPTQEAAYQALPTGSATLQEYNQSGVQALSLNISDPSQIAAASAIQGSNGTPTQGSSISSTAINALAAGNPPNALVTSLMTGGQTLVLSYAAGGAITITAPLAYTGYTVTSQAGVNGGFKVLDGSGNNTGVQFTVNGGMIDTGTFNIALFTTPFTQTGDNANLQQMSNIQTAKVVITPAGSVTSPSDAYGQLVTQVGSKTNAVQSASLAQTAILNQDTQAQQSLSGVNLDEEAANLMNYERAYQASSKVIGVASNVFNALLSALS